MIVVGHGGRHDCLAKGGPGNYRSIGATRGKTAFLLALTSRVRLRRVDFLALQCDTERWELGGKSDAVSDGVRKICEKTEELAIF